MELASAVELRLGLLAARAPVRRLGLPVTLGVVLTLGLAVTANYYGINIFVTGKHSYAGVG
ncbi:hypothetical protein ACFC1R_25840 [Kitasatospora sp. NPDC056138]|uniref:hypothetical protein n=1 Tax=Kitasatospora sp. NPDC056138 TaxID=3345724 RepID=UPI0035DCB418